MKKNAFYLSAGLLFSPVSLAYDVMIDISGSIADNSCDVVVDNISVPIGDVALKTFTYPGQVTGTTAFTIELTNCRAAAKGVKVSFTGNADPVNTDLLQLDNPTAAGSATGMAVGFLAEDRITAIPLNTSVPASTAYNLDPSSPDNTILNFYAQYQSTGAPLKAGIANATATFYLEYQ
ncbi:type 1 fimbrial protein [Yersinia mollaretii]|uniref:fimbrial protein n=1 Tax=Yersinia mollaretii TaxID=33060 RepID=UPI001427CF81|nr:fimbrial protein [Yersinia mollaretii]MDA5535506.1 fimbrial protein [Yersinia mollaretii]NIL03613.1 type 1 fimbrial protein [Yersinia mollaretii]